MADKTQTIEFEGERHEFPADFTDADIQKALTSHSPASTGSPMVAAGPQISPITSGLAPVEQKVGDVLNSLRPLISGVKAFGSDIAGIAHWPIGQNPYPGMGIEQKTEAMEEERARDTSRKQAGYSVPYRAVAPVAESLGVNVPGMEEAATRGDQGAIYGHAAAGLVPYLGARGGMSGADTGGTYAAIKLANSNIEDMSHNFMFNGARTIKDFVKGTQDALGAHVGMLKQGAELADKAAIPRGQMGSVNLTDIIPEIDRIAKKYKGPLDIPLDKFDRAVDSLNLISGKTPYVDLETLLDMRTGIGKLWHSARDSMDAAATAELRDVFTGKAKDRFEELGQGKQFNSYNKVWKNLLEYEDQGVLGKLLNTPSGKPFFDVLNNKTMGPQLRQLNKDLSEQAGFDRQGKPNFPPDYFKQKAADFSKVYAYTNRKQGLRGVFSETTQHPIAAGAGALAGGALGKAGSHPWLGMLLGGKMGTTLAESLAAVRNMSKLGGTAPVEGLMGPRVEPDFGGGLSGQVLKELEKGPTGSSTKRAVSKEQTGSLSGYKPEDDTAKQVEQAKLFKQYADFGSDRPLNPKVAKTAAQVQKLRAKRGK